MANLALGIKNSIIFLLIILIAYFAIKKNTESFTLNTSASLDKTFEENPNCLAQIKQTTCKKPDDLLIPLSSTCDANIDFLPEDTMMKVKEDCQIEQDKNIMIIKKYEDEKKMNNIDQEVGADAYDEYDTYFELYK